MSNATTTADARSHQLPDPPIERWITTLRDVVTIRALIDPTIEKQPGAIATASDDALVWTLPTIGPTCVLMAHRFATYAASGPSTWEVEDIARTFGIGESVGRVAQSIARLERFDVVRRSGRTLSVRLWLPPLTPSAVARLPRYLALAYKE